MDAATRIEMTLARVLEHAGRAPAPPRLRDAFQHAVFPGGQRIRPRLCLAVAAACGDGDSPLAEAAAAAIELLHCASLVHDDLPCFDDAAMRRGRPSVQRAYGEPLAVLAGDGLIVLAFEVLAQAGTAAPARLAPLLLTVARAIGLPAGIVAGQGWECEPAVEVAAYQRAKTGALFAAATAAGAVAAGADGARWHALGERLGEAYQVADDIRDVIAEAVDLGKPVGRDAALGRPSAVGEVGLAGAAHRLERLVGAALDAIPPCAGAAELRAHVLREAGRLLPQRLARPAA